MAADEASASDSSLRTGERQIKSYNDNPFLLQGSDHAGL